MCDVGHILAVDDIPEVGDASCHVANTSHVCNISDMTDILVIYLCVIQSLSANGVFIYGGVVGVGVFIHGGSAGVLIYGAAVGVFIYGDGDEYTCCRC